MLPQTDGQLSSQTIIYKITQCFEMTDLGVLFWGDMSVCYDYCVVFLFLFVSYFGV